MTFEDLRLVTPLLDAVRNAGYETPTPIQQRVIPTVLDGRDVLACAQTGTGKTAAFALPILQRLAETRPPKRKDGRRSQRRPIRTLVLAPTRELAIQISESFSTYGRFSKLRHTAVFGGVNKNPQARSLRAGVDILVATPGRLLDHMADGVVKLDTIEILVLDEADRMLDMGFMPDIKRIMRCVPKQRQTLLLSATMPAPIRELAHQILDHPVSVEVTPVSSAAETVEQYAYQVEKNDKPALLSNLLENTAYSRALVFTRTKYGADKVVRHLTRSGVEAAAIHGNKSQNARTRALTGFKSGKLSVLVATDIAARGLDVDDISHVINYDLTNEPETYVHRIGRTGRAGATGTALSFVSRDDHGTLRAIERLTQNVLQPAGDMPGYTAPAVEVYAPKSKSKQSTGENRRQGGRSKSRFAGRKNARRRPRRGGQRKASQTSA